MNTDKLNVVVLISGSGSNLQAFIDHTEELNIRIKGVISNKPDAFGLERAKKANIPAIVLAHDKFESRTAFDAALTKEIDQLKPELIILAGFMRILSEEFVNHFADKIVNIHPSLLPKYKGLNTHQRALDAQDKFHGASVHLVTPELDDGPVIIQGRLEIKDDDTIETLQKRIHFIEHKIYPQAVKWIAQGDIEIIEGKVIEKSHKDNLNDYLI